MTPSDPLIDSYRAAQKLQNATGPSELTRRRILAHAEQLANSKASNDTIILSENTIDTTNLIANKAINTQAANDSQWKIRVLASIAVFGIAGLLMLQFSKDAPEEFLPKAKPPAAVERSAVPATVSENESKTDMDKSAQTPAAASVAAAPAPAIAAPAVIKPAPTPDSQLAKSSKKDNLPSRNDLEAAAPRAEALAEKATQFAPPPTAGAPPTAPAPAPTALTSAAAPAAVTDSAKLSRSTAIAPRARITATTDANANAKLFNAIQTKDAVALKLALAAGDDKNAKNNAGTPALSLCVQSEQLNLVRLLIDSGADVNALDALGVSPLVHARNRGFIDIVNLLLNSGAK